MSIFDTTTERAPLHAFTSTGLSDTAEILAAGETTPEQFSDELDAAFGTVGTPPSDDEWAQLEAHFARFHAVDAALAELLDADRARLARVA